MGEGKLTNNTVEIPPSFTALALQQPLQLFNKHKLKSYLLRRKKKKQESSESSSLRENSSVNIYLNQSSNAVADYNDMQQTEKHLLTAVGTDS